MSREDFPPEEFDARIASVRAAMDREGLDWFLAFHPASIHWLTGAETKGFQAFQCLLIPSGGGLLVMFTRESERAEFTDDARVEIIRTYGGGSPADPVTSFLSSTDDLGLSGKSLGWEVPAYYLHPAHHAALRAALGEGLVEHNDLVHDLRLVKSPCELELIRRAASIADRSVAAMTEALGEGLTELEVVGAIFKEIMAAGGGQLGTHMNFVSGARAAFSHGGPTDRRLAKGDTGNAEYGVPYRRYVATIGRQFVIGNPSEDTVALFDVARAAADVAIAAIRDGAPATAPHDAAKRVIDDAGLGLHRIHPTGYSLAPAFPPATGDRLQLFEGSRYTLRAGMVVSICPPIFIAEERRGARLVDTVLVTDTGAEMLTRASRDPIIA